MRSQEEQYREQEVNRQMQSLVGRDKSFSLSKLFRIQFVVQMIAISVLITLCHLITKGMANFITQRCVESKSCKENECMTSCDSVKNQRYQMVTDVLNFELLTGLLMILVGMLSSTKLFGGRKLSIILILVVLLILWNIVWISSSRIY